MKEAKKTTYREVTVYVSDNGYSIHFKDYRGESSSKQGFKVAKTLDEVKKILAENLMTLKD